MKLFVMLMAAILVIEHHGWSQGTDPDQDETYSRANIAFSGFSVLGISDQAYTRAVKSENYLDPEKRHRKLLINGEEFLDDGRGNDRAGNDGILTSTSVYEYKKGMIPWPVGVYTPVNRLVLTDEGFRYGKAISPDKIIIKCKFLWVSCESWPPEYRQVCRQISWPFNGIFEVKECEITWQSS